MRVGLLKGRVPLQSGILRRLSSPRNKEFSDSTIVVREESAKENLFRLWLHDTTSIH